MSLLENSALFRVQVCRREESRGRILGAGLANSKGEADRGDYLNLQRYNSLALAAIILLSLLVAGCCCGNLENSQSSGPERFKRAALNAVCDLQTVIPLAGACVFAIDDFDEKVSDWASKHNPIFGSENAARDFSDLTAGALGLEALLTAVTTVSGVDPNDRVRSKQNALCVEGLAFAATYSVTDVLKDETRRTRPDGDDRSFPSGHSSYAFSLATIANRNLDYKSIHLGPIHLQDNWRRPLQVLNLGAATGVAWARVEGRKHYPSDVLFGAGLGHCLTAFVHDYFIHDLDEGDRFRLLICPCKRGAMVELTFYF